jgi:serine/threonine-protein kinase
MSGSGSDPTEVSADAIRAQLERIVASESFARSSNSVRFLRFIVDETLEHRGDQLKEPVIGTELFKIKDFDPRIHSSVRKEAQRLRERLEEHYNTPGRNDPVRIAVPKGKYKPEFQINRPTPAPRRVLRWATGMTLILALAVVAPFARRWVEQRFGVRQRGLPAEKRIAVLPFANVDTQPDSDEFRRGLLFTLTARLSQIERFQELFWVAPAGDVLASSVDSAGKACLTFGANLVVTGSIERGSGRTRLTANLIQCVGDRQKHLNSRMIDSQLPASFVLQDEVVRNVVEMLELKLEGEARVALLSGSTTEPHAEDFYLQARGYLLKGTQGVDHAIELFGQALGQDKNYALAYAGLAEAYLQKYNLTKTPGWIDRARASCDEAIRVNSNLPAVYITKGMINMATGHYPDALNEYRRALEIDPRNPEAYQQLASAYASLGNFKEAERTYKLAIENHRDYWGAYKDVGVFYYQHQRYDAAMDALLWAKKLAPDNPEVEYDLGGVYIQLGRYAEAEEVLKQSLEHHPTAVAYNNLSAVYFYEKRYADAISPIRKAVEMEPADASLVANLSRMYRLAGYPAEAAVTSAEAIHLAKQQLEINTQDADLVSSLALLYAEIGDRMNAFRELGRARALPAADATVLFRAVWIYELLGDRVAALQALVAIVQNGQLMEEIRKRPELEGLRRDPKYEAVVGRSISGASGQEKQGNGR